MRGSAQILTRLYCRLLALHPRRYREEYGDELRTVFGIAAEEAAKDGLISLLHFCFRELRDLPPAALRQHMKERKKSKTVDDTDALLAHKPTNWREVLLAAAPFLYFGLVFYTLTNGLLVSGPRWVRDGATLGMLTLLLILFLLGLLKGFPRWSLPPMGFIFVTLLYFGLTQWTATLPLVPIKPWYPVMLRQLIYQIRLRADILLAAIFILVTAAALVRLTPFYEQLKRDWTRLSFTLYGAAMLILTFTFEDYRNEEPYVLVASLFLAGGSFAYLKCGRPWQRMLALLAGLTLAMAVAALGKGILISSPNWPWPDHRFSWQSEVMSTVSFWAVSAAVVFVPALFLRLVLFSRKSLNYR